MINIRYTLRAMRKRQLLDFDQSTRIANQLKTVHFGERDVDSIKKVFTTLCANSLFGVFKEMYVDMKHIDAIALIDIIAHSADVEAHSVWKFPRTLHWIKQFEERVADLPTLGPALNT
jgi:hypothetical protein